MRNAVVGAARRLLFTTSMNGSRAVRAALLAVALAAALPFASCGGGGGGGGGGGVTNPPPPSGGGGGGGGSADVTITIVAENGNMSYSPNPATVNAGQSVAWRNSAGALHTATQNSGGFDTGIIGSGGTSSPITMTATGTFDYHCAIHPDMVATLTVR
jgi:plastocyanin